MTKRLKAFLTVVLVAFGTSAYADPPARVGRLNHVTGAVSFASADAPDAWAQAVLNRPVTSGDRLWAADAARAELHVGSTAIRLGALTSVDVLNLDDDTLQMRLAQGAVNIRVRDLAQGEFVEIATPAGAVLVRQPGSYRLTADSQSGTSRVLVNFGQAEIITPFQTVTVPSGQSAAVSSRGIAFEVAAYATADDFDRWSAERDRREDRVASTRYVSRDMTGYEDLDDHGAWRNLPEYGAVWIPTHVAPGWAPYRHGHWTWVSPWGWTWIDDAPWGFAPFHYGRWVWAGSYWAWAPGAVVRRPVYAPALVVFVGGSRWTGRHGPAVGWFPLGFREPYRPWYRASDRHVRNVNVTHVTNVTQIHSTTNVTYVNRTNPRAVTVIPQQAFVSARPVSRETVPVAATDLAQAQVQEAAPPARPRGERTAYQRPGSRPPMQVTEREVLAVNPVPRPAVAPSPAAPDAKSAAPRHGDDEPRARVIGRDRQEARGAERRHVQHTQSTPSSPAETPTSRATAPAPSPSSAVSVTPPAPAATAAQGSTATNPAAAAPAAAAITAASAPQASPRPGLTGEERRAWTRDAQPSVAVPPSAAPASAAPPLAREAGPDRPERFAGARGEERAARAEQRREDRATARLEARDIRPPQPSPASSPAIRSEARRAMRLEEAPAGVRPQPGPDWSRSPQREARPQAAAPQTTPQVIAAPQPRAAEPPRFAPGPQPRSAEGPRDAATPQARGPDAPRPAIAPQAASAAPAPATREHRRSPQ